MATLCEVIRDTTSRHLDEGLMVAGQCLSAVGWVGGTLPERHDMTELPTSDVAQSGFIVGAALAGRRPIYVVRYQGFMLLNSALILSYAAKSAAMWGRDCPILIRAIAMEGGIGPVNGSSQHSLFTRFPGVRVAAPMTPNEWLHEYEGWRLNGGVVYLSEHRGAWGNDADLPTYRPARPDFVVFASSITRFAALEASNEERANIAVHHVPVLRPFAASDDALDDLSCCGYGIVLDDDFDGGVASEIAQKLAEKTGASVWVKGLDDRVAGFGPGMDNLPPDAARILHLIGKD
jgi:hypothetical protein